jgi:hypothetical protein
MPRWRVEMFCKRLYSDALALGCLRGGLVAVISGQQVRAARALLNWTARELARSANVRVFTVDQIERATGPMRYPGLAAVEAALKAEGIVFFNGVVQVGVAR